MDLNVQKFNDMITDNCQTLLNSHAEISGHIRQSGIVSEKRASIDRNLVTMSVASQKILDLVAPLPSTGTIMGLPDEATSFGDELDVLIVDKENPHWDFRPWFTEKSTVIRDSVNRLMALLEDSDKETPDEVSISMTRSALAEIHNKAEAIIEMITSER